MDVHEILLAHKYAQAFVTVFEIRNEWIEPLNELMQLLECNKSLLVLLTLPTISVQKKTTIFCTFFSHIECIHALELLLIRLINDKQVLLMSKVIQKIITLYYKQQGVTRCWIECSHPIQETHKKYIQDFITRAINQPTHCVFRVNSKLIAGIRIQTAALFWQYSIRGQIQALRTALMR